MQQDHDGLEDYQISTLKLSIDLEVLTLVRTVYPESQAIFTSTWNNIQTVSDQEFKAAVSHARAINNGNSVLITSVTHQPDFLETNKRHLPNREIRV